jgi:hypothetical protein
MIKGVVLVTIIISAATAGEAAVVFGFFVVLVDIC